MTFLKKHKRGFSLIELLVVMAIFVFMTALILSRQNKYSSDSEITNLAYKMGLAIRQAQVYGLSVKGDATSTNSPDFNLGYGIHFDSKYASTSSFILFADEAPQDFMYEPPSGSNNQIGETILTTYKLDQGITVKNFCVDNGVYGINQKCLTDATGGLPANLDIVFNRPNPVANISFYIGTTGQTPSDTSYFWNGSLAPGRAVITIQSPLADMKTKCIIITKAGQISVEDATNTQSAQSPKYVCGE